MLSMKKSLTQVTYENMFMMYKDLSHSQADLKIGPLKKPMPWTYLGCISTSSLAKSQGFSEGIAGATGSMSPLLNRPALWVTESWDILPLQLVIGTCLSCHLPNTQRMQRLQFVRSCWIIAEQMEVFRIDAGNLQILDVMWRCCSTLWVLWLTWASIGLFLFQPSCSWPNPFPQRNSCKKECAELWDLQYHHGQSIYPKASHSSLCFCTRTYCTYI